MANQRTPKGWQLAMGAISMVLSQIILWQLFVYWGGLITMRTGEMATRHWFLLTGAVALQVAASVLLRSKTVWWQMILWALCAASVVLALQLFLAAFPFNWALLVPAMVSLAISVMCAVALTYLQDRYVS